MAADQVYIRANQAGFSPKDKKTAIAFSHGDMPNSFELMRADDKKVVFTGPGRVISDVSWGQFSRHLELDFSNVNTPGEYVLRVGEAESLPVRIEAGAHHALIPAFLEFMGQQRCGYNPWLDAVCHQYDGRSAYGPMTNGTFVDVSGGWHDAGDLLKYMITSGNATAQMLLAAQIAQQRSPGSKVLEDRLNGLGQPGPNGIPDLLDEARWGLEWMLKMHPTRDTLCHQIADDRDHAGLRLPQNETVDYGWGPGRYRVVYFADGKPQGLQKYQSESTGMANIAGRYAAAMALAWQTWHKDERHRGFAEKCLQAGIEVYELGRANEGVQQGNSFKAPYRYEEGTWADDMEWGAAELYRATKDRRYLRDAIRYARLAATDNWMGHEQTGHYQYYPFMNVGHFRLYEFADRQLKRELANYYREGIERCVKAGEANPYRIGVPFIWCSNNLTVALATQCLMYEMMTGDAQYREFTAMQRDWLLGRNPWGYSMFTGIGTVWPKDTHLMTVRLTKRQVAGGLVDGPVYERIFKSLRGVSITEPDPLADFQGPAVYHDDFQDYSSNEPTMDGTASAILLFVLFE
jgi:endoglucanase